MSDSSALSNIAGRTLSGEAAEKRQLFWSKYTSNATFACCAQPTSNCLARIEMFESGIVHSLPALEEAARASSLTVNCLFLAAYSQVYAQKFMNKSADADYILVGIYLANRSFAMQDILEDPSPTVNMVPLRVRVGGSLQEAAQQIQEDLQDLQSLEIATTSLWEIYQWTGVKIDTFCNFLRIPEQDAEEENDTREQKIKYFSPDKRRSWRRVVPKPEPIESDVRVKIKEIIGDSPVKEAYLVSLK